MRADEWRQRLQGHEFDRSAQGMFEQISQRHDAIKRFHTRIEFHKYVNVAVNSCLVSLHGPKQRKAPHAHPQNSGTERRQTSFYLGSGQWVGLHTSNLPSQGNRGQCSSPTLTILAWPTELRGACATSQLCFDARAKGIRTKRVPLALQMQANGMWLLLRDRNGDQWLIRRMPLCGALAEREVAAT